MRGVVRTVDGFEIVVGKGADGNRLPVISACGKRVADVRRDFPTNKWHAWFSRAVSSLAAGVQRRSAD